MPLHLVDRTRRSSEDMREISAERSAWLREHGVDPGDWCQVYPVLLASWKVHGIPSALDRARAMSRPT